MDIKKIKAIVDLIKDTNIAEIEITEGEEKLRISCINKNTTFIQHPPSPIAPPNSVTNLEITKTDNGFANIISYNESNIIKSPMVGTFYGSSSPSASAFVKIDDEIKVGQVLCIIEAMKLMNQIESDKAGILKKILLHDGDPVEYGQTLFIIE